MIDLSRYAEPMLLFGHDQELEDPRDGLMLFGPLDKARPEGVCAGVVGTKNGISRFRKWAKAIQGPIIDEPTKENRPPFVGFETAFRCKWNPEPFTIAEIDHTQLMLALHQTDGHQRVFQAATMYEQSILRNVRHRDSGANIWFAIVPDELYKLCRPKSFVLGEDRVKSNLVMSPKFAKRLDTEPALFGELNEAATPYHWDVHFHNQLKARLLPYNVLSQVIRESTIAPFDFVDRFGRTPRGIGKRQSEIAWNLCTSVYYKIGGRPWKIANLRKGVCYIGLVFKRDEKDPNPRSACCAAQMFLDSGDGVVFIGAVGPWYNPKKDEYHLKRHAAKALIKLAIDSYMLSNDSKEPPNELFIHGRVKFNKEEWEGFEEGVDERTNLVGIKIRDDSALRLYKKGENPVLRGLGHIQSTRMAYLWTSGYIPRVQTYPGREVPIPLSVEICRGKADMNVVLNDIMALTKLNYNTCIFADGMPVTLRFANAVGEILTAGPVIKDPPLSFRYYI